MAEFSHSLNCIEDPMRTHLQHPQQTVMTDANLSLVVLDTKVTNAIVISAVVLMPSRNRCTWREALWPSQTVYAIRLHNQTEAVIPNWLSTARWQVHGGINAGQTSRSNQQSYISQIAWRVCVKYQISFNPVRQEANKRDGLFRGQIRKPSKYSKVQQAWIWTCYFYKRVWSSNGMRSPPVGLGFSC